MLAALDRAKIIGVRAGTAHRYTGVWVVVIEGRVFVRSWNDKPSGWYRAFRAEPAGSVQVAEAVRRMRGVVVRSQRLKDAVSVAYGTKYNTAASQKWVEGFARPERVANTLEIVPA